MLDLAAVAGVQAAAQGVSRLVYDEVMTWAGYSKDEKLALLEFLLEKDGKLEAFKSRFQEVAKGRSWDTLKNDLLLGVTFQRYQNQRPLWRRSLTLYAPKVNAPKRSRVT